MPYPTSCAPQAWSAAAPLLLLRAMLRFDPNVAAGQLGCDPVIPDNWLSLRAECLNLAGQPVTVEVERTASQVSGLSAELQLVPRLG